jgi:peptidoglycan/LPS O-acetylase OafA/YrhL
MKRRWNWSLWVGFLVVVIALFSYEFFVQFPITRDFPWANLLLFTIGGVLLGVGLFRAYGRPAAYRGKIVGPILTLLSVLVFGLFAYALFYVVRQMPASAGAPKVGETAPDFTLADQDGKSIALHDLLQSSDTRAVLLIFYRGYW